MPRTAREGRGGKEEKRRERYSAGIYARISVDSHSEKNESVENQIEIAKRYLDGQPDMALYGCYSDVGKSGTDFCREGFERLMDDVRKRRVNCIIVKDFSRFGRNYVEMGNYLEKIFPFLGVRFVSVTDGYDTLKSGGNQDLLGVHLKNLVNELYAKDIAIKVRASRQLQKERGSYTGGIAPYGYKAQRIHGKKILLAEAETAGIVRELFERYGDGKSQKDLAAWLYEHKIHRPSDYRKTGHVCQMDGERLNQWDRGSLKGLLQNPVYLGCLKHTQEAVVSEELFFSVAERFARQSAACGRNSPAGPEPAKAGKMKGLLFCGGCKTAMLRTSSVRKGSEDSKGRFYAYRCPNSGRMDHMGCEKNYLSEAWLEKIVKESLRKEFLLAGVVPLRLVRERKRVWEKERRELLKQKERLEGEEKEYSRQASEQYLQYRQGRISQEDFLKRQEEWHRKTKKCKEEGEACDRNWKVRESEVDRQCRFLRGLFTFSGTWDADGEMLPWLISRIEVYPSKRMEMTFHFTAAKF